MNIRLILIPVLLLLICSAGCITAPPAAEDPLQPLDYSLSENWAYLPNTSDEKPVDVFYLYPTLFKTLYVDSMNTSDPELRNGAVTDVLMKKGIFEETANIYAPFYRQTGLYSMLGNGTWTEDQYIAEKRAYEDVKAAFLYYLENYNEGKPFILAGHSQGSYRIKQLMIDLFVDPDLQDKLIAAYPIGYTLSEFELAQYPQLKAATGETDTGVIITYNTQAETTSGKNIIALPGAVGINPLNWKTDATPAITQDTVTVAVNPEFKVLTVSGLDRDRYYLPILGQLFPKGNFHLQELELYKDALRENVKTRLDSYRANNR